MPNYGEDEMSKERGPWMPQIYVDTGWEAELLLDIASTLNLRELCAGLPSVDIASTLKLKELSDAEPTLSSLGVFAS
jgi:hypothetical protein